MSVCLPPVPAALAGATRRPGGISVHDRQRIEKDLSEASDEGLAAKRPRVFTVERESPPHFASFHVVPCVARRRAEGEEEPGWFGRLCSARPFARWRDQCAKFGEG